MRTSAVGKSSQRRLALLRDHACKRWSIHLFAIAIYSVLLALVPNDLFAQARLILNGANVNLAGGAHLVISNDASNAITRNSGHIISEGENNKIKWNIGVTTGTYVIPWGYSENYIPLTFTKTAGTGSGYFLFSTYHTEWLNSSQLPSTVSNLNGATGSDNSAFVADRFWEIDAQGYTSKPSLSNLTFTYLDEEHTASGNTIAESGLRAQRYNSSSGSWWDNIPDASLDISTNTVTVASVSASDLHPWWKLVTPGQVRYWVAPSASSSTNTLNWSASSGGVGGAGVPTSSDVIIFDEMTNSNCTLTDNLIAVNLWVKPGYSGLITQGSSLITISNTATFSGGTFVGGTADITINGPMVLSGTAFTATSATLELKDDFIYSSGTFAHNNGTLRFSGTSNDTQTISGASTATFNNISVANTTASPGVSIETSQNLKGILTLAGNSSIDADGSSNTAVFKLLSTNDSPTQDAAIASLPAGAMVTGNVTAQRFMTKEGANNTRIYRYISSPLQNATVADIQQEIPVTGSFTGSSNCSGCNGSSMYFYNESIITDTNNSGVADLNDGYIDFPDVSNTEILQPGRGYALFVRGNILSATSWDVRGMINAANVTPISFPVSYTTSGTLDNDGWNLVGNPFPSAIDWNASSGWTKSNISSSVYVTDNGSAASTQFAAWNGVVGTNGGSRYIAMGQAFWVKATGAGAPVLIADESVKAPGTQTIFFKEEDPKNLLRITMLQGSVRDEMVIHFREDATPGFDAAADAWKFKNSSFNLSSLTDDGKELAINSLPHMDCATEVKLLVNNTKPGTYQLKFTEFKSFAEQITIQLKDNFTNQLLDIRKIPYHNFMITSDPASFGSGRFAVLFNSPETDLDFRLNASPVCESSDAQLHISDSKVGISYTIVHSDSSLSDRISGNGGNLTLDIPAKFLHSGENIITIRAKNDYCSEQFIEKNIILHMEEIYSVKSVVHGNSCKGEPVTLKAFGAPKNGSFNWYESETSLSPQENSHDSVFVTPPLAKSRTYYVSIVNSLGCEGLRYPVYAEVVLIEDAVITMHDNVLTSNHTTGNQWYYNGNILPGATDQFLPVKEAGSYSLQVTLNGCVTTTDYEFSITGSEIEVENHIKVFPNPASDYIFVEMPASVAAVITEIKLFNSLGQQQQLDEISQGSTGHAFDLRRCAAGVYTLSFYGNSKTYQVKVILE